MGVGRAGGCSLVKRNKRLAAISASDVTSVLVALALVSDEVSLKSFAIACTLPYHGSRYSCACSSAFLLFTGESVAVVAAATSAFILGTISPFGHTANIWRAFLRL